MHWRYAVLVALSTALLAASNVAAEQQPIDVLREHIAAGIAVLTAAERRDSDTEREQLCALTREMFDVDAFSRLALAGNWKTFSATEQAEFVSVFGEFLCRYYISRLQARYTSEEVRFLGQTFSAENRASVKASVTWQDLEVPVEVRMVRRDGRWKAYDLVVAGISGVLVYRAQFEATLLQSTPRDLIADLRRRIEEQG